MNPVILSALLYLSQPVIEDMPTAPPHFLVLPAGHGWVTQSFVNGVSYGGVTPSSSAMQWDCAAAWYVPSEYPPVARYLRDLYPDGVFVDATGRKWTPTMCVASDPASKTLLVRWAALSSAWNKNKPTTSEWTIVDDRLPTPPERMKGADWNLDGVVNNADLLEYVAAWAAEAQP